MRSRLCIAWSLAVMLCALAGCQSTPKPARVPAIVQSLVATSMPADFDVRRYLAASRTGEWTYRRSERRERTDKPEVEYVRRVSKSRLLEGEGAWQVFRAIEGKLPPNTGDGGPDSVTGSETNGSVLAFRFVLDEPMAPVPENLKPSQPSTASTRLQYLTTERVFKTHGELTRTAVIEGYEDVDVPAGHFAHCLRVRVNFTLDVRWGPTIHWLMYVWLSPQVGDVKCVQNLSGWFLIFRFASSFEYELVSHKPPAASQPADAPVPLWKDGLLAFDRGIPSPRIGALLVNFD